jgi:ring-1,2-phenylacetyl-CoA epoxidase subunit PaaA
LRIPDDDLVFDETSGHYRFGDIDWREFHDVLAGNGPCNRQRLAQRQKAHDDGEWVRAAASACAEKRRVPAAA